MDLEALLHHFTREMKKLTTTQFEYLKAAELFLWALAVHFTVWFTGEWKRWKRTEYNLPRIVKKGALIAVRYRNKLVYTVSNKGANNPVDIEHGLTSTEALLMFKAAANGEFVSERYLRSNQFKSIPEWAVIYPRSMILFEYSTSDNFRRHWLMKHKLERYRESLDTYNEFFNAEPIVLFVFDAEPEEVERFVEKYGKEDPEFYFADLASFMGTKLGHHLDAPIYLNGVEGTRVPLT